MKTLVLGLAILMASSVSMAKDSQWSLCSGPAVLFGEKHSLVMNIFERRNDTGDGRVTEAIMIFGNYTMTGSYESVFNDTRSIVLKSDDGQAQFNGKISPIKDGQAVVLRGVLGLPDQTTVDTTLKCQVLR